MNIKILSLIIITNSITISHISWMEAQNTQQPYVLKDGLRTHLVPDGWMIAVHEVAPDKYDNPAKQKIVDTLDNVAIFNQDGKYQMTLGIVRNFFRIRLSMDQERYKYFDQEMERNEDYQKWTKVLSHEIRNNNGVVCPGVVPPHYGFMDTIKWTLMNQEKEPSPALVVGTKDCEICKDIQQFYNNKK